MDRGDWWAIVCLGYSRKESDTTEQLTHIHIFFILRLTLFLKIFLMWVILKVFIDESESGE